MLKVIYYNKECSVSFVIALPIAFPMHSDKFLV